MAGCIFAKAAWEQHASYSANCSLGWQRELILDRSPSEGIYVGNHFVLGIKKSEETKAILLLGGRRGVEDTKLVVVHIRWKGPIGETVLESMDLGAYYG